MTIETHRPNASWRKARISARLLWRADHGGVSDRDAALGRKLAEDDAVTPRLLHQALHALRSRKRCLGHTAGRKLDLLARQLPPTPALQITVFGSATLPLLLKGDFRGVDRRPQGHHPAGPETAAS